MIAIEFQTFLGKDRIIKVPEDFSEKINGGTVRVIVLAEEETDFDEEISDKDFIKHLIENPFKVDKSVPFLAREEIYDRKL